MHKGSQNHRDAAPEWLIGSELLMVQDPFDDTGSFTNTDGGTFTQVRTQVNFPC